MKRHVLVTGGAGFIGSHVAEAYLAAGYDVTVLDDLSTGRRENLPAGVRLVHADVGSPEAHALVARGGFDVVNHHAAQVDVRRSVADPVADARVNVLGLVNLVEGARAGGVRRLIFASSAAVYGEDAVPPIGERAAKLPASPYGAAKLAAEHYLAMFARLYAIETVVLRYSNVYGPRQDPRGEAGVVAIFGQRVLAGRPVVVYGDGEQTRDLIHVTDVAAANVAASRDALPARGDPEAFSYNIGTGIETSVNQLARLVAEAAGRPGEVDHAQDRAGEIRRSALQVDKACVELAWVPGVSLPDGLRSTMHWLAAQKLLRAG